MTKIEAARRAYERSPTPANGAAYDRAVTQGIKDRRNARRRERDQLLRDLGLVKVRGALGGTYWE